MSYEERLGAVLSLQPPAPTEGEVRCRTPGCRSEGRLKRTDLSCWWCGSIDIEVVSEELKVWMRVPLLPAKPKAPSPIVHMYPPSRQMPDPILADIQNIVRSIAEHLLHRDYRYEQQMDQIRDMRRQVRAPIYFLDERIK